MGSHFQSSRLQRAIAGVVLVIIVALTTALSPASVTHFGSTRLGHFRPLAARCVRRFVDRSALVNFGADSSMQIPDEQKAGHLQR